MRPCTSRKPTKCLPVTKINQAAQGRVTVPQAVIDRGNVRPQSYHPMLVTPLGAHNTLAHLLPSSSSAIGASYDRQGLEPHVIDKLILKATVKEGKQFKCLFYEI